MGSAVAGSQVGGGAPPYPGVPPIWSPLSLPLRSLSHALHVVMLAEDRGVAGNRSPGGKTHRRFSKRSHRAAPRVSVGRSVVFAGRREQGLRTSFPLVKGRVLRRSLTRWSDSHQGESIPAASPANNPMPGSGHPTSRSADGRGIGSRGYKVSVGRLVVLKAAERTAIRTLTSVLRIPPGATPVRETRTGPLGQLGLVPE